MEDPKIGKPWIDTLFPETKNINLVSYLRLEFNIDFLHHGMSFCMHKNTFLKCDITATIVRNFETILSEVWPKKGDFRWKRVSG